jgi:hypothetical protein
MLIHYLSKCRSHRYMYMDMYMCMYMCTFVMCMYAVRTN